VQITLNPEYDVLIVGAGPAGSAAAIKCAEAGLNTLLIDRAALGRHKPCAGILPTVATYVLDELGLGLPSTVLSEPSELGIFYVPPSGRASGGELKNYRVFNLDRDLFDRWLVEKAVEAGAHLQTKTTLLTLNQREHVEAALKTGNSITKVKVGYVIGADGAHSTVRRCLEGEHKQQTILTVMQEYWEGEGEFGNYFYTILNTKITPTYGYLLKKRGNLIVGTGSTEPKQVIKSLGSLKDWLAKEFSFRPLVLKKREVGFLPYGDCYLGCGRILLVGDAAGLCNRFSGEGIRFALESGIAAAESVKKAENGDIAALEVYRKQMQPLLDFVKGTIHLHSKDDPWREEFVLAELKRFNLW
jgi:geranylgeranyl reductase family protein